MIVILKQDALDTDIAALKASLQAQSLCAQEIILADTRVLGLTGHDDRLSEDMLLCFPCVERIAHTREPYTLAGRGLHPDDSVFEIAGRKIGGGTFAVIAGPCSVESEAQLLSIAREVEAAGAAFLRGGAFKPRTSPYAFPGLGLEGLSLLKAARQETGLPIVTEIMSSEYLDAFAEDVDVIQIGTRNMQNFPLLRAVGSLKKPVLLKRGLSSTLEELLMAAEYVITGGSSQVILCERGIRTFEPGTRSTLDLSAVPILKRKSHLPVVVDPSHATGDWRLVESMALAATAAGCDGLIIEVHNDPKAALCDGSQSITPKGFAQLMDKAQRIRNALFSTPGGMP